MRPILANWDKFRTISSVSARLAGTSRMKLSVFLDLASTSVSSSSAMSTLYEKTWENRLSNSLHFTIPMQCNTESNNGRGILLHKEEKKGRKERSLVETKIYPFMWNGWLNRLIKRILIWWIFKDSPPLYHVCNQLFVLLWLVQRVPPLPRCSTKHEQ